MAQPQSSSYGQVSQEHNYESDLGFVVLPVAQRTPGWRRIRLHGGLSFRRIAWQTSRAGLPPIIPRPDDVGTDLILSFTVTPSLPVPNPEQGGYNWSVRGEYLYLQGDPRAVGVDALPTGSFPFPIAPNDGIAAGLLGAPVEPAVLNSASILSSTNPSNDAITNLGNIALSGTTYVWPFTSLAPAFSDHLFGE